MEMRRDPGPSDSQKNHIAEVQGMINDLRAQRTMARLSGMLVTEAAYTRRIDNLEGRVREIERGKNFGISVLSK
jgi:hypothetical protein